jgi:hypothetical protein
MRGEIAAINGASSSNLNHCKASGSARRATKKSRNGDP